MKKVLLVSILVILSLGVLLLFIPFSKSIVNWDGGFPLTEFVLKFEDKEGRIIKDLSLEVLNESGQRSHQYPIREFVEAASLKSNSEGVFSLHQTHPSLQYGGTYIEYYGFIKIGDTKPPKYRIKVFKEGVEVYSFRFSDLYEGVDLSVEKMEKRTLNSETFDVLSGSSFSSIPNDEEKTEEADFFVITRTFKINKI